MDDLREELLEHEEQYKGPMRIILAIFLLFLMVMWMVPISTIPLNPEPSKRLTIEQATQGLVMGLDHDNTSINSKQDYWKRVNPREPSVKVVADRIVSAGCDTNRACQAKALFYFVRDELNYVSDPSAYEYVKGPVESLQSTAGDCDDASVLLASMLGAVGIKSRFVFVTGHVYVEAQIPEAINRYKQKNGWIVVDGTCRDCDFGQLAIDYIQLRKTYV